MTFLSMVFLIGIPVTYLLSTIVILREYERAVVFRLGRIIGRPWGPGLIIVLRPLYRIERVSLRTVAMDVPAQDVSL